MESVSEAHRYIVRSVGVRSGNPIVESTRIAVHDVIGLLQNGETIETIQGNCFPLLTRSQIYECLHRYGKLAALCFVRSTLAECPS